MRTKKGIFIIPLSAKSSNAPRCFLCGGGRLTDYAVIAQKPARETDFYIKPEDYLRRIMVCRDCGVFVNLHAYDLDHLYKGVYNQATYGDQVHNTYLKIRSYPQENSINKQRIKRVVGFLKEKRKGPQNTNVLDVGSGLCVFPGELKDRGFKCTCIDPDPSSVQHALDHVKVDGAFCGTLADYSSDQKFGLIAFNKVLEHIKDPVAVLADAKRLLAEDGYVYIELPDATGALKNGKIEGREEFYMEHYTVFTEASVRFLANRSGYEAVDVQAIHEPGDKYTLYAFLKLRGA